MSNHLLASVIQHAVLTQPLDQADEAAAEAVRKASEQDGATEGSQSTADSDKEAYEATVSALKESVASLSVLSSPDSTELALVHGP